MSSEAISYKNTLNLPTTDFSIRASSSKEDPILIERWESEGLYSKIMVNDQNKEIFVLHDGPPYANAHIHLGTAYNKILKDIFAKSRRMSGFFVPVIPGWDCHGLPIELKVTTEFPELKKSDLKQACRNYANKWIKIQKEEFRNLGVVMDFENPYLTMNPEYESEIIRSFGEFYKKGYISRKNKTVPWCASCETVLASAEIEYQDRKDPSIFVSFKVSSDNILKIFKKDVSAGFIVWTTTPWTLPLNRAVALKPGASYDLLEINDKYFICGSLLSENICKKLNVELKVVAKCLAEDFKNVKVKHPFIENFVPIIFAQEVSVQDGTAAVHSAPGCGADDYEWGIKNGLEIYSPITTDGRYSSEIEPKELEGMKVCDAISWVMTALQNNETLIFKESIKHSYPHCWRCRNGLIFRATKQWFCELSHDGLRDRALSEIEKIQFIPARTKNHLKASLSGRLEWCLSRQRSWGVPIPSLLCLDCDLTYINEEFIEKVAKLVEKNGIEAWDDVKISDLIDESQLCKCGSKNFRKEQDILDVWFDSGVSHAAVLKKFKNGYPADLYIEGVDQHRGWFQSSLLTSMVLFNKACMKTIATHGYTVDDKGRKMSKSLGNVMAPQEMIDQLGTDGLRLWVSSIEVEGDVVVSKVLINNVAEVYRKIRNTCRFLLSNLYDFDNLKDSIKFEKLTVLDQYALSKLSYFNDEIKNHYKNYNLTGVYHSLTDFCTVELSSFYLDIVKDRLYVEKADGYLRRSAQTACFEILQTLTKAMAPIMSFAAEQISDHYNKNKKESIHLEEFAYLKKIVIEQKDWQVLKELRCLVLKTIEKLRERSIVKHSLEVKVTIFMNRSNAKADQLINFLSNIEASSKQLKQNFLKEILIVSQCIVKLDEDLDIEYDQEEIDEETCEYVNDDSTGFAVRAVHAQGVKCPRCWQWEVTDHENGLCLRCINIVASFKIN